ncbi:MAG: precorrin-8X methylmutase [Pseudomonadota bacterium]
MRPYERDPQAIYAASFATVRAEANLARFPADLAQVATRVIHACGMVEVADRLAFSPDVAAAGRQALARSAPIYTDCEMVASGLTHRLFPGAPDIRCTLNDPRTADLAQDLRTTRSAAAVDLWDTDGAVIAIGNAPTALFRLLERLDDGAPRPAAILAFPVGFVGAAESKAELAADPRSTPFLTLRGRRGGSAMASAAVNALALLAAGGIQ